MRMCRLACLYTGDKKLITFGYSRTRFDHYSVIVCVQPAHFFVKIRPQDYNASNTPN